MYGQLLADGGVQSSAVLGRIWQFPLDPGSRVRDLAAFQYNTAESYLRRQVGARERLVCCNDEVKGVCCSCCESCSVTAPAQHVSGCLSNHLALLIEQEHGGASGFDFLGKIVFASRPRA